MAWFAKFRLLRAEAISAGANCVPSAPAALSTAALDTATSAVAGVFKLLHPSIKLAVSTHPNASQSLDFLAILYLL
jgi:hypothetical protein